MTAISGVKRPRVAIDEQPSVQVLYNSLPRYEQLAKEEMSYFNINYNYSIHMPIKREFWVIFHWINSKVYHVYISETVNGNLRSYCSSGLNGMHAIILCLLWVLHILNVLIISLVSWEHFVWVKSTCIVMRKELDQLDLGVEIAEQFFLGCTGFSE